MENWTKHNISYGIWVEIKMKIKHEFFSLEHTYMYLKNESNEIYTNSIKNRNKGC